MQHQKFILFASALVFISSCATAAPSDNQTLIRNASFEKDPLTDNGGQGQSWHFAMKDWHGYRQGIMRVSSPAHFSSAKAPHGRNVAFLSFKDSWMEQVTNLSLAADRQYTLRFMVGVRQDQNFAKGGNYMAELYAGETLLAKEIFPSPTPGIFVEKSLSYQTDPIKTPAAGKLKIKLTNLNARQINFDQLSLENAPRPLTKQSQAPTAASSARTVSDKTTALSEWETVGLWTYDAVDGQRLGDGLVLTKQPGSNQGRSWQYKLELTSHNALSPRHRVLWPVDLNRKTKQVCVDGPYPSFSGYINMPRDEFDGVYAFASCKGGQ